jgi:prolyl-tRNA synthetase
MLHNVSRVVREEMDRIGAQEVLFPALLPKEPVRGERPLDEYGDLLFRPEGPPRQRLPARPDPRGAVHPHGQGRVQLVQGPAVMLYQVQTKYRDEARPRAGILRGREFVMKDSYSFDLDDEGLQRSYDLHREAYVRIFERLGMDYRIVSAVSGAMGGSASEEFLAPRPPARTPSCTARRATTPRTPRRCS